MILSLGFSDPVYSKRRGNGVCCGIIVTPKSQSFLPETSHYSTWVPFHSKALCIYKVTTCGCFPFNCNFFFFLSQLPSSLKCVKTASGKNVYMIPLQCLCHFSLCVDSTCKCHYCSHFSDVLRVFQLQFIYKDFYVFISLQLICCIPKFLLYSTGCLPSSCLHILSRLTFFPIRHFLICTRLLSSFFYFSENAIQKKTMSNCDWLITNSRAISKKNAEKQISACFFLFLLFFPSIS